MDSMLTCNGTRELQFQIRQLNFHLVIICNHLVLNYIPGVFLPPAMWCVWRSMRERGGSNWGRRESRLRLKLHDQCILGRVFFSVYICAAAHNKQYCLSSTTLRLIVKTYSNPLDDVTKTLAWSLVQQSGHLDSTSGQLSLYGLQLPHPPKKKRKSTILNIWQKKFHLPFLYIFCYIYSIWMSLFGELFITFVCQILAGVISPYFEQIDLTQLSL